MELEQINEKYAILEGELLYNKSVELLKLISDAEFEKILKAHKDVFTNIANISIEDKKTIKDPETQKLFKMAICIFSTTIRNRQLTKEKFNAMSFDEALSYLKNLLKIKDYKLYNMIHILETSDTRNTEDSRRVSLS